MVKMADFKGYLLCRYACNQKINSKLWHLNTICEF